jgi:hypothetical protein
MNDEFLNCCVSLILLFMFMNHGARLRGLIGGGPRRVRNTHEGTGTGETFPANITGDENGDILLLRGAKRSADPGRGYPRCHP